MYIIEGNANKSWVFFCLYSEVLLVAGCPTSSKRFSGSKILVFGVLHVLKHFWNKINTGRCYSTSNE